MFKEKKIDRFLFLTLIVFVVLGVAFRVYFQTDFIFDKFIDRDLFRSIFPDKNFLIASAELNGGGRTPGAGLHLWLAICYYLTGQSITGIYIIFCLLHFGAIYLICHRLNKYFGQQVALIAGFLFSTNYFLHEQYLTLWNPTLATLFSYVAFALMFDVVLNKNFYAFLGVCFSTALAMQMHTSNIMLVPVFAMVLLLTRTKIPIKFYLISLVLIAFPYVPFILDETNHPKFFSAVQVDAPLSAFAYFQRWVYVIANLVGTSFFSFTESLQWLSRAHFESFKEWLLLLSTSLPIFGLMMTLFAKDLRKISSFNFIRIFLILGLVAIVPILIFSFPNQYIAYRRFLWLTPIFLTASALGISAFVDKLATKTVFKNLGYGLFVVYGISSFYYSYSNRRLIMGPENFSFKSELINIARKEFDFSNYDIQSRVGLIATDSYLNNSKQWVLRSYQSDEGTGLISLLGDRPLQVDLKRNIDTCLMVIRDDNSDSSSYKPENIGNFLKEIKSAPSFEVKKIVVGKKGVYFSYRPIDSQCISFFKNYYFIPEKNEIFKLMNLSVNQSGDDFVQDKDRWLFSRALAGNKYFYYLQIEQNENDLIGNLFASTDEITFFRGIGYFYNNPQFLFQSSLLWQNVSTGLALETPLWKLRPEANDLFTSPLFFKISLPPSGSYRLSIRIYTGSNEYFDQALTNNLQINKVQK